MEYLFYCSLLGAGRTDRHGRHAGERAAEAGRAVLSNMHPSVRTLSPVDSSWTAPVLLEYIHMMMLFGTGGR